MYTSSSVKQLLTHAQLWQASSSAPIRRPAISTGYPLLDKALHCGGWPQGQLSELLLSQQGLGEIRLLCPLLHRLSQQPGDIGWINPPFLPYAPSLLAQGIAIEKQLIIQPDTLQQTIWAAAQAMASNACSAVLVWLPDQLLGKPLRKLNLAARQGNCWGFIFRSSQLQQQPSAAALRILLQTSQSDQSQQLTIIKQPGGWAGQKFSLNLFPERDSWSAQSARFWPEFIPSLNTESIESRRHSARKIASGVSGLLSSNANRTKLSISSASPVNHSQPH